MEQVLGGWAALGNRPDAVRQAVPAAERTADAQPGRCGRHPSNGITVEELQDMVNVRPGPNGQRLLLRRTADRTRRPVKSGVPDVSDRTRTAGPVRLPLWPWAGSRRHRAGQDVPARREHHVQLRDAAHQRLQPSQHDGWRHGRRHAQHRLDDVRSVDGRRGQLAPDSVPIGAQLVGASTPSPWSVVRRSKSLVAAASFASHELRNYGLSQRPLPKGPAKAGPFSR